MVFFAEEWFWRGTQSAIFYYVSCTPWFEYKRRRKRREEARRSRKERETNDIYMQPGVIKQPAPFQTNTEWGEEIVAGPGPPKGWQKDAIYFQHAKISRLDVIDNRHEHGRGGTATSTASPAKSDWTAEHSSASTAGPATIAPMMIEPTAARSTSEQYEPATRQQSKFGHVLSQPYDDQDLEQAVTASRSWHKRSKSEPTLDTCDDAYHSASRSIYSTESGRSSLDSSVSFPFESAHPRRSMEQRLSSAMDGVKEAMRAALHPDQWNWIRYDRDDEILPDLNERMKSMWDTMKVNVGLLGEDTLNKLKQAETKETNVENEVKKWQRGTHPAINNMHPPVVSQLPYSREEARWMLMPPPSADVMMGRRRPDPFDDTKRRPLCIIGAPQTPAGPDSSPRRGHVASDMSDSDSNEGELLPQKAHVQKPQRAYLFRAHSYAAGELQLQPPSS